MRSSAARWRRSCGRRRATSSCGTTRGSRRSAWCTARSLPRSWCCSRSRSARRCCFSARRSFRNTSVRVAAPMEWRRYAPGSLAAFPGRLALVQEGVHAFAEILAHVAREDEVVAFAVRDLRPQAEQRFLGRLQRERRHAGDEARELLAALHERRLVLAQ